jgi:peroxiredoxin
MSKFLLFCLTSLLLSAVSVHAAPAKNNLLKRGGPPLDKAAPDFSLLDVNGKQFRLADYQGKTVVLNFWAFWCDTWKAEMPSLNLLAGRQKDMNFTLLAVSVDGTRLSEFQRHTSGAVPFPVLLDVSGVVTAHYQVRHVPTVVIIGPDGTVRFTADGYPGNFVVLRELRKIER